MQALRMMDAFRLSGHTGLSYLKHSNRIIGLKVYGNYIGCVVVGYLNICPLTNVQKTETAIA